MNELKFLHLLYSYDECKEVIKKIFTEDKYGEEYKKMQNSFLYQAFESSNINRIMFNEHMDIYTNSKFDDIHFEFNAINNNIDYSIDNNTLSILKSKYGDMRYDIRHIYIMAKK